MGERWFARKTSARQRGIEEGYRSGLEERVAAELAAAGVTAAFESHIVYFTRPAKPARYTPDFLLPNGILIETKGRFVTSDRQKHLAVKQEHPDLDIRFVFSNSRARISKQSATMYSQWCLRYGFKFADKSIPPQWIKEPALTERFTALQKATRKP